jgi:hypothetical protein
MEQLGFSILDQPCPKCRGPAQVSQFQAFRCIGSEKCPLYDLVHSHLDCVECRQRWLQRNDC